MKEIGLLSCKSKSGQKYSGFCARNCCGECRCRLYTSDLAMTLEDEVRKEVPDEALEKMKTVGDVVAFIEEE